jgi:hypothetical protein
MKSYGQDDVIPLDNFDDSITAQRRQAKMKRERERMQARRARRVTYDLPPELRERLNQLSSELRIPASQLAALAIVRFLSDLETENIDLPQYKRPSLSPRYDWNLELPKKWKRRSTAE